MTVALIGAFVAIAVVLLEQRHARRMKSLESKNDDQHAKGYGLLQSIDTRTMSMDEKLDDHSAWIARHDVLFASGHEPKPDQETP